MKAKLRETGEVVELRQYYCDGTAKGVNGEYYHQGDISELFEDIDYKRLEYEFNQLGRTEKCEFISQHIELASSKAIAKYVKEYLFDMVQGLVDKSMAEIREGIEMVNKEQARKVATLSTDIYNVLERRQKLLYLERKVKQHKGQPMLLTKSETASLLLVDYSTLRKWARKGFLVPKRITPHRELYRYSDVLKILEGKV